VDLIELVGYHGTNYQAAISILENGFKPSTKKDDWLGEGAYFWQDAPYRAWDWATRHHENDEPTVIQSIIIMKREECIDLLDFMPGGGWAELLNTAHKSLQECQDLPTQRIGKAPAPHPLDKIVIDYLIKNILAKNGIKTVAVRAAFEEGKEIFSGSALYDRTHIQVSVRDNSIIQSSTILQADDFIRLNLQDVRSND
jgi:hypothetical protein